MIPLVEDILRDVPSATLTCAGTVVSEEFVKSYFRPEYRERIYVLPKYSNIDLPDLLNKHDVMLFPSRAEGCCLSILESMASGLIVISTPVGNVPELIRSGENGYILNRDDFKMAHNIFLSLRDDPEKTSKMSYQAIKSVSLLNWKNIADDRIALWNCYLSENNM